MKKLFLIFIFLTSLTSLTFGQDLLLLMGNAVPADTVPTQFTFTDVTEVSVSSWNQAYIVVAGCDSARFTISSGDSLKLGALGTYDVSAIWADVGDTVYVSQVASASYNTAVVCTLSAGGISDIYSVTTLVTPPYFDQFIDGNYASNPTWTVGSGTFAVQDTLVSNPFSDSNYGLVCTSAGLISVPSTTAYGTWEFEINRRSLSGDDTHLNFMDSNTTIADAGAYSIGLPYNGVVAFNEKSVANLFSTGASYIAANTWYGFKITRAGDGTFTVYIKGGAYGSSYIEVVETSGSNPILDNTNTTSNYMTFSTYTNDYIMNIKAY